MCLVPFQKFLEILPLSQGKNDLLTFYKIQTGILKLDNLTIQFKGILT